MPTELKVKRIATHHKKVNRLKDTYNRNDRVVKWSEQPGADLKEFKGRGHLRFLKIQI